MSLRTNILLFNITIIIIVLTNCTYAYKLDRINENLKSFSLIKKFYQIEKKCNNCESYYDNNDFTLYFLNNFLKENALIVASSFIISKDKDINYHITANHVCDNLFSKEKELKEKKSIDEMLLESSFVYNMHRDEFVIKRKIILESLDKKEHLVIEKISSDTISDICIVSSKNNWGIEVILSSKEATIGDILYNITGILGMRSDDGFIIYTGIHSGNNNNYTFLSTVYAKPGSSGSPVFNSEGYLVGSLHTTYRNIKTISVSSNIKAIKKLAQSSAR